MPQSYSIALGTGRVELNGVNTRNFGLGTLGTIALQVVSNAALDASVTLKLQQSMDGVNWHDLPETPLVHTSGVSSSKPQTTSFLLNKLALHVDVGTATLGTLTIYNPDID